MLASHRVMNLILSFYWMHTKQRSSNSEPLCRSKAKCLFPIPGFRNLSHLWDKQKSALRRANKEFVPQLADLSQAIAPIATWK